MFRETCLMVAATALFGLSACGPSGSTAPPEQSPQDPAGKADGAGGSFDWGSDCASGNGEFSQAILKNARVVVGEIPVNKRNVKITLASAGDVDIQLVDKLTAVEIVAWPNGLLRGATQGCATHQGLQYCYSGYNGVNGQPGNEWIEIKGDSNRVLVMKAFGYAAGNAKVSYSWLAVPTCNEIGSGSFTRPVSKNTTIVVGDIPKGKTNIAIELKETSARDVDVQLVDKADGKEVIAWPGGLLSGAGPAQTTYKNMKIKVLRLRRHQWQQGLGEDRDHRDHDDRADDAGLRVTRPARPRSATAGASASARPAPRRARPAPRG